MKKEKLVCNKYPCIDVFHVILTHQGRLVKSTQVCFENKSTEKKNSATISAHPKKNCYMEHPLKPLLKPPQSIEEVVAEVFLKFFPIFVTLKTSAKTYDRRCFPCNVSAIVHAFNQLFSHLMGRHFKVKSNHDNLKYFLEQ
jgi:hypothetical protein